MRRNVTRSVFISECLSLPRHHASVLTNSLFDYEKVGFQLLPCRLELRASPLDLGNCASYLIYCQTFVSAILTRNDEFFKKLLILDETLVVGKTVMHPFFEIS
jgi:hypothetical protein